MFGYGYRVRTMHAGHPCPGLDVRTDSAHTAARAVLDVIAEHGATAEGGAPNVALIPREGASLVGEQARDWALATLRATTTPSTTP